MIYYYIIKIFIYLKVENDKNINNSWVMKQKNRKCPALQITLSWARIAKATWLLQKTNYWWKMMKIEFFWVMKQKTASAQLCKQLC